MGSDTVLEVALPQLSRSCDASLLATCPWLLLSPKSAATDACKANSSALTPNFGVAQHGDQWGAGLYCGVTPQQCT